MTSLSLSYKLAVLVFIENERGEQLLLLRAKAPNLGSWSPIGGKLETARSENRLSNVPCERPRKRRAWEIEKKDLHLFAMIAEKAYEGQSHWLMFLFRCHRRIAALPENIAEGKFGFFSPRAAIDELTIPATDRSALWPVYDRYRDGFVALNADCAPGKMPEVEVEEIIGADGAGKNRIGA